MALITLAGTGKISLAVGVMIPTESLTINGDLVPKRPGWGVEVYKGMGRSDSIILKTLSIISLRWRTLTGPLVAISNLSL